MYRSHILPIVCPAHTCFDRGLTEDIYSWFHCLSLINGDFYRYVGWLYVRSVLVYNVVITEGSGQREKQNDLTSSRVNAVCDRIVWHASLECD